VGNHESTPGTVWNATGAYNITFAAFTARFAMPAANSGGNQNLWFSYDYKNVHYISVSTEHDYSEGSPQWTWAAADLAAADANRAVTPWIMFVLHRPMYCTDSSEYTDHCPGAPLAVAWEPLLTKYGVDLVYQGHMHMYERMASQINGTVITPIGPNNTWTNPAAPVYMVVGASGAMQAEVFVEPQPAWSIVRMQGVWGYGRMRVTGSTKLYFEFVDTNGVVQDYFTILKTGAPVPHAAMAAGSANPLA
jgi:hypothetical protein